MKILKALCVAFALITVAIVAGAQTQPTVPGVAENYGASPSASGAVNTRDINKALAKGGLITITTPGTYTIAASSTVTRPSTNTYAVGLVIPSGTTLRCGAGVILQEAASQTNPVIIQNSNVSGGNTNVSIEGCQFDGNSANETCSNPTNTDLTCMVMWLQNINGLKLQDVTVSNPRNWGIGVAQITYGNFYHLRFPYTAAVVANQGGLQVEGPNSQLTIRDISGNTYDDLVGLVPYSTSTDSISMAGPGPQTDILVNHVHGDETSGAYHLVRLGDNQSGGYPMARVTVRDLSGAYTDAALVAQAASSSGEPFDSVLIDGVSAYPLAGSSPSLGYIDWTAGAWNLTICNVNRTYVQGQELVLQPVITFHGGGVYSHLKLCNWNITDETTSGAGMNLLYLSNVTGMILETSNMSAQAFVAASSDTFLAIASGSTLGRWVGSGFEFTRINKIVSDLGTVSQGWWLSNIYSFNNPGVAFIQNGAHSLPYMGLHNVRLDGTQGGAAGCLSFTSVTGTVLLQEAAVTCNNSTSPVIVRAASEAIRVQGVDLPVTLSALTPSAGDTTVDAATNALATYSGSGWFYPGRVTQAPAYAATVTPVFAPGNANAGNVYNIGALTGAITVANPATVPPAGDQVTVNLVQDTTGARAVSWGTDYQFPTSAWTNTGNTVSTRSSMTFVSDGTNLWAQGANTWH